MSTHIKMYSCKPNSCKCTMCRSVCTDDNPVMYIPNESDGGSYFCRKCLLDLQNFHAEDFVFDYAGDVSEILCDFCSNILTQDQAEQWSADYEFHYATPIQYNVIATDLNGKYNLWNRCDDCYYNGIIMQISYCPKCGRKLD